MKKTTATAAMIPAVALLVAGSAGAYRLDRDGEGHPLHWTQARVEYLLAWNNTPAGTDGEEAVHSAFRSWSDASSGIRFRFADFVDTGTQRNDGRNVVYWIHDDWPYDPTLIASTFRTYDTSDGTLLDADIVMNADGVDWSVGGLFSYDIENTVAHEVGHLSGLGHSGDSRATMAKGTSRGETSKRTLARDDLAGLDALYGQGEQAAGVLQDTSAGGGGGCSIGTGGGMNAAQAGWLIALLLALGVRSRISAGRGSRPQAIGPSSMSVLLSS